MKLASCFFLLLFVNSILGQESVEPKVFRSTEVDVKPNLQDGMYTLTRFVGQNYHFPDSISNKQIKIFTSFIIEPDGTMSDIKSFYISVRDLVPENTPGQEPATVQPLPEIYSGMQAEAARVLSLFDTRWTPALVNGEPVRCLFNYPISFNLE